MVSPPASGLVGLIVIDASGDGADVIDAQLGHDDATLSQLLRWLTAGGDRGDRSARGTTARVRRAVQRLDRPLAVDRPARVAADCRALGVQLERAAGQLRRDLAAPPSPLAPG